MLCNLLTVYALFVTPFVLVFTEKAADIADFELFVDIVFTIEIIFNFVRLEPNQKESDFR